MRFIIEFDGPIVDVLPVFFTAHEVVAKRVGWSRLDQATFRRMTRAKDRGGEILPGAGDTKVADYWRRFDEEIESDSVVATYEPHAGVAAILAGLAEYGTCTLVTLGSNVAARKSNLQRLELVRFFRQVERLSEDARRRPGELRMLAAGDERTVVVAASDSLVRACGEADLFCVGLSCGACGVSRLHQAGASVVLKGVGELLAELRAGCGELIRAGLLPPPLG